MSLAGNVLSVPLGGEEILITVGGQPRVGEAGSRRKALGFTEFSAVRAGPRATRSRESPVPGSLP